MTSIALQTRTNRADHRPQEHEEDGDGDQRRLFGDDPVSLAREGEVLYEEDLERSDEDAHRREQHRHEVPHPNASVPGLGAEDDDERRRHRRGR